MNREWKHPRLVCKVYWQTCGLRGPAPTSAKMQVWLEEQWKFSLLSLALAGAATLLFDFYCL